MSTKTTGIRNGKCASKIDFMRSGFDWSAVKALGLPTEMVGDDLYVQLDDVRRAVVSLAEGRVSGTFDRLSVKIVSKTHGKLDTKSFTFGAYLPGSDKVDNGYRIIAHTGWSWYIARPTTTRPLIEAVAAYVRMFK